MSGLGWVPIFGRSSGSVRAQWGSRERGVRPVNDTARRGPESIPKHKMLWLLGAVGRYMLWNGRCGRPPPIHAVAARFHPGCRLAHIAARLVHDSASVVDKPIVGTWPEAIISNARSHCPSCRPARAVTASWPAGPGDRPMSGLRETATGGRWQGWCPDQSDATPSSLAAAGRRDKRRGVTGDGGPNRARAARRAVVADGATGGSRARGRR